MNSFEIGNPKNQTFLKPHLKQRPTKNKLVDGESPVSEEHQISLKTNKGAQHMNLWLKANPSFDNDEVLESFLSEAKGLLMMFDAPSRYFYQDIPKFIVYVMQMYMCNFGDNP